jgi:hypothetical protein
MADDGKRTELICVKVTERMALDLLWLASSHDRTVSDFMYVSMRDRMYGCMVRRESRAVQPTTSDKVDE